MACAGVRGPGCALTADWVAPNLCHASPSPSAPSSAGGWRGRSSARQCAALRRAPRRWVTARCAASAGAARPQAAAPLAYEAIGPALPPPAGKPPTALLLHGVLGAGRNWSSFTRRLASEHPTWQFILPDLRCHGNTAELLPRKPGPHTVATAASDVMGLMTHLGVFPRVIMGHSFGGKVVLSMLDQAARIGPLPRPLQVWVLDAMPGRQAQVPLAPIAGGPEPAGDGTDAPARLLTLLQALQPPFESRAALVEALTREGFSLGVAQWAATSLKPASGGGVEWRVDLDGVASLYWDYEAADFWPLIDAVPLGARVDFLRAERSLHYWTAAELGRIQTTRHVDRSTAVHTLPDAGHWLQHDNPAGLLQILKPSFSRLM